jgi:serine/threonine-protein kinase
MTPQQTIAHYRITAKLGQGGMGEVWRATDTKLGREVAIKILPAAFANDLERMARFEREAHVLASLNHPNFATIYGVEQGAIVMELVEGEDLKGPLPLDTALNYARQIALALEAAHEKGIVHRDLKPANIKVTPDGVVKVLDFGLAKAVDGPASQSATQSPTVSLATQAGVILGTAGYMSPEQARGKAIDRRADIWAFGAVLYEMLAGRRPFDGETVTDVIAAVVNREPDWSALPPWTPPHIRELIGRCLRKDARTRLQAIGDARIAIDEPPAPMPAVERRSQRTPWVIAGAAVVAAVGVAVVAWGIPHRPQFPAAAPAQWRAVSGEFRDPVLSRDGTHLMFREVLRGRLMMRALRESDAKPLPGVDNVAVAEFSPDSQWVALETDRKVKKIRVGGGDAVTLAEPYSRTGISWGEDNTIVYVGEHGLMRVSSAGGKASALTSVTGTTEPTAHRVPHFVPGAKAVLFTVSHGAVNQIAALDLKTGQWHVVIEDGFNGMYAPTGHLVFTRQQTLYAAPFDLKRLAVTGPEVPVITGLSPLAAFQPVYSFSDNGLLVYLEGTSSGGTTLAWMDRTGHIEPVSDEQFWGLGRLSPDGRSEAIDIRDSGGRFLSPGGGNAIWVFDLQRRTKIRLADAGLRPGPIWTPDGRRITFAISAPDRTTIWWMPADGSARPESILTFDGSGFPGSWSPDGKTLFFNSTVGNQSKIWMAPFSGGKAGTPQRLHDVNANESEANISPDGKWLAYQSDASGQSGIYLEPFPPHGGRELVSTGLGVYPRWSRDEKELYYFDQNSWMGVGVALGLQPRLGTPRPLAQTAFGTTFDPAPDGKRFLVELPPELSKRGIIGITDWFTELRQKVPVR